MTGKRFPLPRRFNAAMSDKAYDKLRALSAKYGYGNNYLLTIVFETLDDVADPAALERVFAEFSAKYGAPPPGSMKSGK